MTSKKISKINDTKIIEELKTFPNQAFIWSIVNHDNPNMWELPSCEAIMIMEPHTDDPFVFIAGNLSPQDIDAVIEICSVGYPIIYCNNLYHPNFIMKGWDFLLRIELCYSKLNNPITLDRGWEFKKVDCIELFKQCYWYKKYLKRYDSHELFFKSNKAYVLCHNDKVISEGYIEHHSSSKYAELSVATNPSHRIQGAGKKIAAYLAEKCKKMNLAVVWSCQIDNRPSLYTALSAGFKIERYYINMVPEIGNTMSPMQEKWVNDNTPIDWNW